MKKTVKLPKVEPVKLKSVFGLKPGVWLTILYSAVLLLLIFLICFLPGIKHGSKRVTFTSKAFNAAVYIDGNYSGGTPYTVKVPSGTHKVEYKVNNELLDSFDFEVSHPVFLTWLFPRHMEISSEKGLTKQAYNALTAEFFEDLASYSAIEEYSDVHRYPPLFLNYAKSVKDYKDADLKVLTDYAVCFITTDEMFNDACEAFELLNLGKPVVPSKTGMFNKEDYQLAETVVTEADFAKFIAENPFWSTSNKEVLIEQGLADSFYLEGTGTSSLRSMVNVSYYAARAYCEWLSEKTGKNYFIPTQQQWTEACKKSDGKFAKTSLVSSSMLGGVWEMTSSAYVPYGDSPEVQDFLSKLNIDTEIVVKGGSFVSKESEITAETAGVSSRQLCSDYMGFRVACND